MKKKILDMVVCPVCKARPDVRPEEETPDEIISGNLYCPNCAVYYPITDGVANMLPPDMRYSM